MIRVVLVDDEPLALSVLREYLGTLADVEVVAECANGFEAVKAVSELEPDLMFLDVQMPKLDGFEVLELVDRPIDVIFVTAFDSYALRAFDVHAVDYLLKPFSLERLTEAVGRARERIGRGETSPARSLVGARRSTGPVERVLVRDGPKVHVIPTVEIDFIQAQDDYVAIRWQGKDHLKEQTLRELESQVDGSRFVRIHRSYLLNVERLARVELYSKDSRVAILRDGTRLPVSRAGYSRLSQLL
jgi:two-component system LytT family response regulator